MFELCIFSNGKKCAFSCNGVFCGMVSGTNEIKKFKACPKEKAKLHNIRKQKPANRYQSKKLKLSP